VAKTRNDILWRFLADTKGLESGTKRAGKSLGKAQKATAVLTKAVGLLGAAYGARELGRFIGQAIDAASDYTESINAVEVATGIAAGQIFKFGDTAADSLGLSKRAVNEAAVAFAAFGENISIDADISNEFADFTQRAVDFASVMNVDMKEAFQTFQSTLAGQSKPIRRFGIDTSAASVKLFAMANGIGEVGKELTETEKQQARYGLLMRETDKFAGDFANTSGELANQLRIQTAEYENASAELGAELLPLQIEWVKFQRNALIPALKGVALTMRGAGVAITEVTDKGQSFNEMLANDGSTIQQVTEYLALFNDVLSDVAGGAFTLWQLGAEDAAEAQRKFNLSMEGTRPIFDQYGQGARGAAEFTKTLRESVDTSATSYERFTAKVLGAVSALAAAKRISDINLEKRSTPGSERELAGDFVPTLPKHTGGLVPGPRGTSVPILAQAGETITPSGKSGGGGNITINVNGLVTDPQGTAEAIVEAIRLYESTNGPI